MTTDSRLILSRPDLASAALEGVVRAARFAEAKPTRLVVPAAAVRAAPAADAEQIDQILFGERFDVVEIEGARKATADGSPVIAGR